VRGVLTGERRCVRGWVPPARRTARRLGIAFAAGLGLCAAAGATLAGGQSATTLYVLNCMGCHPSPTDRQRDVGPLRGEFFHSDKGRNFFVRMPAPGRPHSATADARLLEEILTWRRSCAATIQDTPPFEYRGDRSLR
jgi:hypothetical protein